MKKCFVISPIGQENTEERNRADKVFNFIIQPVCKELGYEAIRSDKVNDSGLITKSILQHIITSDLVIADLTDYNPNVFYELAIRHSFGKAIVQIIDDKHDKIPFDVSDMRTIFYSLSLEGAEKAKNTLKSFIESFPLDGKINTPISEVANILNISDIASEDSSAALSQVITEIQKIPENIKSLEDRIESRISQMFTSIIQLYNTQSQVNQLTMEEKMGALFLEKMIDNPSKGKEIINLINQFQQQAR